MALNSVTLTGSVPGGSGAEATFTQSAWLTDSTDNELIPPISRSVTLDANGKFSISLLATDNAALLPAGWTWSVVISGINVASLGFSFFLPFSGGATQDIADLAPVQPTASMAAYMPLPSGTPSANQIPIATGVGETSAWGAQSGGSTANMHKIYINNFSGADPTGATLSDAAWTSAYAAAHAAITTATGGATAGAVIVFGEGVYKFSVNTIRITDDRIGMIGAGKLATTLFTTGTNGIFVSVSGGVVGGGAAPVGGFSLYGWQAGAGNAAFKLADRNYGYLFDIHAEGWQGNQAMGFYIASTISSGTEGTKAYNLSANSNDIGYNFDGANGGVSFDFSNWDLHAGGNGTTLRLVNGASNVGGKISLSGNIGSATYATSNLVVIGSSGTDTAQLAGTQLHLAMEADPGSSTINDFVIQGVANNAGIRNCYGTLFLTSGGGTWSAGSLTGAQFSFTGPIQNSPLIAAGTGAKYQDGPVLTGYDSTSSGVVDTVSKAYAASTNATMGYRAPGIQLVDKIFMGQSGGFSPTFSGVGATGNNTDTSDFVLGTYAVKGATSGSSGQCNISGSFGTALNLTGKCPVVWVKLENYANFLASYPRLFLGDTGLTNVYQWKLTEATGQPWALDGEWLRITLPMGSATVIGSPSRSSLAALTIQTFDGGTGPAVVHLGGLATMAEPVAWPNGVLSLCFDDGLISQFQTAKPYMDKYGFRATAYVITETLWNHGSFSGYYDIPTARALESESGWEIGAHAYTAANHNASYTGISDAAALTDMQAAKAYLRAQGFKAPDHFAYPLGNFDSATVINAQTVFGSGRTISQLGGFPDETFPPAQISRLRSIAVSANSSIPTIEGYVTAAQANKEWLLLTMHDILTSASGNVQLSTANFQALMDFTAASGIQVMPVSEVLRAGMTPQVDPVTTDYTTIGTAVAAGATGKFADVGHAHAVSLPIAEDFGYVAWSGDMGATAASAPLPLGALVLVEFFVRSPGKTISNIGLQVTTGQAGTSGQNLVGVYDTVGGTATLRAQSADQTTNWGTPLARATAMTSPYVNPPVGRYYAAFLVNGTTSPTFRTSASTVALPNLGLAAGTLRYATFSSGLTALPASFSMASMVVTNAQSVAFSVF